MRGLCRLGTRAEALAIGVHEAGEVRRAADEIDVVEAVARGARALEQHAHQAPGTRARLETGRVELAGEREPLPQRAQTVPLTADHGIDRPIHEWAGDGFIQHRELGVEAEFERMGA